MKISIANLFFIFFSFSASHCVIISSIKIQTQKRCNIMKELRELLRDLRDDHNLKQKTIATYLGISQQAYSNYETGHREIPIWVVIALAKYYKVSTDYLLGTGNPYLGNTNLKNFFLPHITMHDLMYDIQTLNKNSRKELLRYIQYLKYLQKSN